MNILCLPRLFIAWSTCLLAILLAGSVYAASAEKKPPTPGARRRSSGRATSLRRSKALRY